MAELKTKATKESVAKFLKSVEPEGKRADGLALLKMFEEVTGEKAVMWGASIVGFGAYHYKSEKSAQEGDWMLTGFSPRKGSLSLYILDGIQDEKELLEKLGKHKTSAGGCLYVNKLADVNLQVLKKLIKKSYSYKKKLHK